MNRIVVALLKPLSFLPALLVMYMIFSFSSQDGTESGQLSYKVSQKLVEVGAVILDKDLSQAEIDMYAQQYHGAVRKLAHMTEYCVLPSLSAFLCTPTISGESGCFCWQASSVWPLPPPTNTTRPW